MKEATNILAASIYTSSIHGNKFNHSIAREIKEKHIKDTNVYSDSNFADYSIYSKISDEVDIKNTRCMDLFNAEINKLHLLLMNCFI